jgi:hypothetical protein
MGVDVDRHQFLDVHVALPGLASRHVDARQPE